MKILFLLVAASLPVWAQCSYSYTPSPSQGIQIPADASSAPNTITVTATAGCSWASGTDSAWIIFPNGTTTAFGNGAIAWEALYNPGPGTRQGHIGVMDQNGNTTVFTIVQAAPNCSLTLNPSSASLPVSGGTGTFQITTNCVWAAGTGNSWITFASQPSGTLSGSLSYSTVANPCVPSLSGSILVQAGGSSGPLATFPITEAGSNSNLTLTPTSLTAPPTASTGTLAIATASVCGWAAFSNVSWLTITNQSTGLGNYNLAYAIQANAGGQRTGSIEVGTVSFTVTQQAAAATPVVLSVADNGASYSQGAVSPGEVVALFGANIGPAQGVSYGVSSGLLPTTLGGVQVFFGSVAAPLLYAASGQVNAVVPYGVTGSTQVQVSYGGAQSSALTLTVQPTTPGILTLDGSGLGGGAILNATSTGLPVNTPANPATPGQIVVIYCVGAGVTNPPTADGTIYGLTAPTLPASDKVTVTIGGLSAQVLYAGAVAESIAGLTQINAVVPPGLTTRGSLPLTVTIGGVQSQSGVTIAIQ